MNENRKAILTVGILIWSFQTAVQESTAQTPFTDRWNTIKVSYYDSRDPSRRDQARDQLGRLFDDVVDAVIESDASPTLDAVGALYYVSTLMAKEPEGKITTRMSRAEAMEFALECSLEAEIDRVSAALHAELVKFHHKENNLETALEFFESGYPCDDVYPAAHFALSLERASIERRLGNEEDCLRWLQVAESSAQAPQDRCEALGEYAALYMNQGLLDLAAQKSAQQWELVKSHPDIARVVQIGARFNHLASLINRRRFRSAIELAESLLEDPETAMAAPQMDAKVSLALAIALDQQNTEGSRTRAITVLENALDAPLNTSLDNSLLRVWLSYLFLKDHRVEDARTQVELYGDSAPRDSNLFASLEDELHYRFLFEAIRLRIKRLEDEIGVGEYLQEMDRAFGDMCQKLRDGLPLRPGGVGFFQPLHRRAFLDFYLEAIDEASSREHAIEKTLEVIIRAQSLGTLARSMELDAPSIDQIQSHLPEGRGLLVFVTITKSIQLYAIDSEQRLVNDLGSPEEFQTLLNLWYESLILRSDMKPDQRWKELGQDVRERVISPEIERAIDTWGESWVVGADSLNWFPVECLPWKSSSTLGQTLAITHLPSLPLVGSLQNEPRGLGAISGPDLGLVHVSTFSPAQKTRFGIVDLPLSDERLAELTTPFPPHSVVRIRDHQATAPRLRDELDPMPRVLHWITHGVFDPEREQPSGLLLFDDSGTTNPVEESVLWCENMATIFSSPRTPSLLMLSVCGSARGPKRIGDDGISHLGGTLLSIGVPCVALSSVELDYHATIDLMSAAQEELVRGVSTAEAFRRARIRLADRFDHPYFHSLVKVFGSGHRPVFPSPGESREGSGQWSSLLIAWPLALVGLGILIVIVILRSRSRH